MNPKELPVYKERTKILDALKKNQVIVVESPTGSGKTTQIPLILHEAGFAKGGTIGITQPRRIAAISVCEYIAKQIDSPIPGKTGYKLRFDDQTNHETEIKIMTDGILLQELKADKLLRKYSVIMVDEAHERSLNIDFTLGLLKQIVQVRKDFRVIISSATINASIFADYFTGAPVIRIKTPVFPVEEVYKPLDSRQPDDITAAITSVIGTELSEKREGDVLVFLPGERAIKECVLDLDQHFGDKLFILPLYGRLSKEEQNRVFIPTPQGKKKVVVSTNIAETSVTIDGITTVIDPGDAKINYYSPRTYISSLIETPISQAAAKQRRGRAGRTQPGRCYRFYSEENLNTRPRYTQEEIYRTDLSEVLLRMAELGITNFNTFDFISKPESVAIKSARETLLQLEAIEQDNSLSSTGELMVKFPLLPRHSRALVEAINTYPKVLHETLIGVAFLSTKSPFILPSGEEMSAREAHHRFADKRGDFFSYLRLFNAFERCESLDAQERFSKRYYLDTKIMQEILNIRKQLGEIITDQNIPILSGGSPEEYLKAIATGMSQWICKRLPSGLYRSVSVNRVVIHPSSVLFRAKPEFIVAGEIFKTSKTFACSVSPIHYQWMKELFPKTLKQLEFKDGKRGESRKFDRETKKSSDKKPLRLLGMEFPIVREDKKKLYVEMDLKRVQPLLQRGRVRASLPGNYRGTLLFQGNHIQKEEKVVNLIKIIPHIDITKPVRRKAPQGNYNITEKSELSNLIHQTSYLMKLSPVRPKGKTLGFISLECDGNDHFWFTTRANYFHAMETSLYSLEVLAQNFPSKQKKLKGEANKLYRKLLAMFEQ